MTCIFLRLNAYGIAIRFLLGASWSLETSNPCAAGNRYIQGGGYENHNPYQEADTLAGQRKGLEKY